MLNMVLQMSRRLKVVLQDEILFLGAKVYGIGYNPNKNKNLFYSLNLNKLIKLHIVDVRKKNDLEKIIKKFRPEIIFHLAAQPLI